MLGRSIRLGRTRARALLVFLAFSLLWSASRASAGDTGVSDSRVSLPEGPGSVAGAADNATVNQNMGSMAFSVPIAVPEGFTEATPALEFTYNSMAGNSPLGIGWDLMVPSIERMVSRGLPEYSADDEFAYIGSQELIATSSGEPRDYRARFEGAFARFRWHNRGAGNEGYWTAEMADGTVGYFGADHAGKVVATARSSGAKGTFRYYLYEQVDSYGHIVRYTYAKTATDPESLPILRKVEYAFSGNTPRFHLEFSYQARVDDISNCKPGFCERLSERMVSAEVFSSGNLVNRYQLTYEDEKTSGGVSRLSRVDRYGDDGTLYPLRHTFAYSKALGSLCVDSSCAGPQLFSLGNIGGGVQSGNATLIDMNGDALPDIVDTSDATSGGKHKFFISKINADGSQGFLPATTAKVDGGMTLVTPAIDVLDVDGDGFVDMVNARTGDVLRNNGSGEWAELYSLYRSGTGDTPDFDEGFDGENAELKHIRFIDYDNDKRIDIVRSVQTDTQVYRNLGAQGFKLDPNAEALGVGFAEGRLQLSDMNGDGLVDPVQIAAGQISYNLNLGFAQWSPLIQADVPTFGLEDIPLLEVEDLNGDELSDLVIVSGSQLQYSLNRDGVHFDDWVKVTSVDGMALPTRTAETAVLFADMNGSGSSDVVWIAQSGAVTCLELFPVLPNLLSRIENGIGMVTEVTYDTTVMQQATSKTAWKYKLPHPMSVVSRMDTWDLLSNVHENTGYAYRDAFYDGKDKQFRGCSHVESLMNGDDNQEEGLRISDYEVGADDPYRTGLLVQESVSSAGRVLSVSKNDYGDCKVDGIPAANTLTFPVRYICVTGRTETLQEGAPAAQHAVLTKRYTYDGYGNHIKIEDLGVTSIGGKGCAACTRDADVFGTPCGAMCLGDERYTETKFIAPTADVGGWQLRKAYQERTYANANSTFYAERKTYYDGPAFQGLALGKSDRGDPVRVEDRVSQDDQVVQSQRLKYDANGNVVESIDPNGKVDGTDHRTTWQYSKDGLVIERTAHHLTDSANKPYLLVRGYTHDARWDRIDSSTDWVIAQSIDKADLASAATTKYVYDGFDRLIKTARPGDTLDKPSSEISYSLASPVSTVSVKRRSKAGGALDIETVQCVDGRGRTTQERSLVRAGEFQVTGFKVFNVQGSTAREYQAYTSKSAACDKAAPAGVPYAIISRDAAYRTTRTVLPDSKLYKSASTEEIEYQPLARVLYDAEDTDPDSPHYATPRTEHVDGLGRMVAVERSLVAGGKSLTHTISYDGLSNLRGYVDPKGNERVQEYDVLGRVFQVHDPDTGLTRFFHDDAGNRTRVIDPRGISTRFTFDALNRLLAQWDDKDEAATKVQYRYDSYPACKRCTGAVGALASIQYPTDDGMVEERFGYDQRERGIYYAKNLRGIWYEIESSFDNADRVLETKYPGGVSFSYETDGLGRITKVPGFINEFTYNPKGDPDHVAYANGAVTTYTHDDLMRLASIETSLPGKKSFLNFTYDYDRAGNMVSIKDESVSSLAASAAATYKYDAVYRLLSASLTKTEAGTEELTFSYDDIDNMLEKSSSRGAASAAHIGKYTYDTTRPHQVLSAGEHKYTYDAAGQMTARDGQTLEWDFMGRMTKIAKSGEAGASYSYGATSDERIERQYRGHRTSFVMQDFEVRDGHAVVYLTVSDRRLAKVELSSHAASVLSDIAPATGSGTALTSGKDGKITAADAWLSAAAAAGTIKLSGAAMPSTPELLLASATRRMLVGEEKQVTFLHHDYLGSTVAATDDKGAPVFEARYYPFGELLASTGGPLEEQRYTGKEFDPETDGLAYYGARYADPSIGRWISADPTFALVNAGNFDRPDEAAGNYLFSVNNPTTMVDEDGRLIINAIGAAVGFVVGVGVAALKAHVTRENRNATFTQTLKENWKSIVAAGVIGAGSGFLTGGLSAIGTLAGGTAEMAYFHYKYKKLERATPGQRVKANDYARLRRNAALVNLGVSAVTGLATGSVASGAFSFNPSDAVLGKTTEASYVNPSSILTTSLSTTAQAGIEGAKTWVKVRKNILTHSGGVHVLPGNTRRDRAVGFVLKTAMKK